MANVRPWPAKRPTHPETMMRKKRINGRPAELSLDDEIAHLRGLDLAELRARWHTVSGRKAPAHLPRHLLFRIMAYRLQADRFGDLDKNTQRLLDRICDQPESANKDLLADTLRSRGTDLKPGTLLVREWQGTQHRVMVLAEGFAWKEKVYRSLSEVAFAITGTKWNGPRFFGVRDKPPTGSNRASR